jgi:hypothetical protein
LLWQEVLYARQDEFMSLFLQDRPSNGCDVTS